MYKLTLLQICILRRLARGESSAEIQHALLLSKCNYRNTLFRVRKRLDVQTNKELLAHPDVRAQIGDSNKY